MTFFIFPEPTWRSHPRPILTQNGSNDVGSRKDVAFGGKNRNLLKTATPIPPEPPKCADFGRDSKFSLDFAFDILGLTSKHPLFFIGAQ